MKPTRVWVVLDRVAGADGPTGKWVPLLNTVRRTRKEAQFAYTQSGAVGAENGFWDMQRGGWCRVVRATLSTNSPKSSPKKRRGA